MASDIASAIASEVEAIEGTHEVILFPVEYLEDAGYETIHYSRFRKEKNNKQKLLVFTKT